MCGCVQGLGALSCPEQCEAGCLEKFGASGYQHDECVKACLAICPGGAVPKDEAQGAFLIAAVSFAAVAAVGAALFYWSK